MRAVFLDTYPLSLVTHPREKSAEGDACQHWLENLVRHGVEVYIPEIADYELRREMVRRENIGNLRRLDRLNAQARYLPITTEAMRLASELWAQARNMGQPTASDHALDGDVILVAQALTTGILRSDFSVATSNPAHLGRFVPASVWQDITL